MPRWSLMNVLNEETWSTRHWRPCWLGDQVFVSHFRHPVYKNYLMVFCSLVLVVVVAAGGRGGGGGGGQTVVRPLGLEVKSIALNAFLWSRFPRCPGQLERIILQTLHILGLTWWVDGCHSWNWSNASQFSIHGSIWIYWIYAIGAMEISSFRESILNHQSCEIRSNFSQQQKRVHCRIGFAVSQVNSQREDTLDTLRRAQNEAMAGLCWCPPGHMSYKTCWCQGIKVYNDA